jgi:DNA-binding NtrC family response regulator
MISQLNFEVVPLSEVPKIESPSVLNGQDRHVVLIVDDERIIADTLSMILSNSGYTVFTAYDGKTALDIANVIPPELLITDVMMPEMTGIELAIALTKSVPDCKILLFSGTAATRPLLDKANSAGYDFSIMAKPVHPTDMLKRVSESLGAREMSAAALAAEKEPVSTVPIITA